jgi:peroxiredoxin
MKWKNLWVSLFLSALITWNAGAQPSLGSVAPDISLPDPNGQVLSLSALRGKMVLVDFWASWCGPCRVTNKKIKPLYEAYQAAGFEIYGVSVDNNAEAWKKAIKADGITWLQVNQPGNWESPVARAWGIEQLPTSYLLDKEGRIIATDPSYEELKRWLSALKQ